MRRSRTIGSCVQRKRSTDPEGIRDYRNADGKLAFEEVRRAAQDSGKVVRPVTYGVSERRLRARAATAMRPACAREGTRQEGADSRRREMRRGGEGDLRKLRCGDMGRRHERMGQDGLEAACGRWCCGADDRKVMRDIAAQGVRLHGHHARTG